MRACVWSRSVGVTPIVCRTSVVEHRLPSAQNPLHQRSRTIDHNPQGRRPSSIIDHHLTPAQKLLHDRSWTIDHRATTIEGRLCLHIARGVMRMRSTLCFGSRTWPLGKRESMHAATSLFLKSHGSSITQQRSKHNTTTITTQRS